MRLKRSAFALRCMVAFCAVVFPLLLFVRVGRVEFELNGTIADIDRPLSEEIREASRRARSTTTAAKVYLHPALMAAGSFNHTHRQDMVSIDIFLGSQSHR